MRVTKLRNFNNLKVDYNFQILCLILLEKIKKNYKFKVFPKINIY